jgi:hypothetical protein
MLLPAGSRSSHAASRHRSSSRQACRCKCSRCGEGWCSSSRQHTKPVWQLCRLRRLWQQQWRLWQPRGFRVWGWLWRLCCCSQRYVAMAARQLQGRFSDSVTASVRLTVSSMRRLQPLLAKSFQQLTGQCCPSHNLHQPRH